MQVDYVSRCCSQLLKKTEQVHVASGGNQAPSHCLHVHAGNLRHMQLQRAQEAEVRFANECKNAGDDAELLQAAVMELRDRTAYPLVLHLDSIENGGHNSNAVLKALRIWLRCVSRHALKAAGRSSDRSVNSRPPVLARWRS